MGDKHAREVKPLNDGIDRMIDTDIGNNGSNLCGHCPIEAKPAVVTRDPGDPISFLDLDPVWIDDAR